MSSSPSEPPHPEQVPRYANFSTFARLPPTPASTLVDVGIIGVPFDGGCTYRSGARFGPSAIRQSSRLLRAYNTDQHVYPFRSQRVGDLGDIVCTPFDNGRAVEQIYAGARTLLRRVVRAPLFLGGDHTISYPLLRALHEKQGQPEGGITLLHFDSHLDTWDSYFGEKNTHGTPFKRAFEEGLINPHTSMHVGIRGSSNSAEDALEDAKLGFKTLRCSEVETLGTEGIVRRIHQRVGRTPCYLSIDIDVVDPSAAPATGTPECGGFSPMQVLSIVRGLRGLQLVGGDVVEVAPCYDAGEITSTLAATLVYEMLSLLAPTILRSGL